MADNLPEGTDRITTGAGSATQPSKDIAPTKAIRASGTDAGTGDLRARAQQKASEWGAQAIDHARDYAEQGKDRASGALGDVAKLIDENTAQIDDRLGGQYGDYARRASGFVNDLADGIREKDIDELVDDAREFVRRSPGIAIAAAAATGFVASRIVKAGTVHSAPPTPTARTKSASR